MSGACARWRRRSARGATPDGGGHARRGRAARGWCPRHKSAARPRAATGVDLGKVALEARRVEELVEEDAARAPREEDRRRGDRDVLARHEREVLARGLPLRGVHEEGAVRHRRSATESASSSCGKPSVARRDASAACASPGGVARAEQPEACRPRRVAAAPAPADSTARRLTQCCAHQALDVAPDRRSRPPSG